LTLAHLTKFEEYSIINLTVSSIWRYHQFDGETSQSQSGGKGTRHTTTVLASFFTAHFWFII